MKKKFYVSYESFIDSESNEWEYETYEKALKKYNSIIFNDDSMYKELFSQTENQQCNYTPTQTKIKIEYSL